MQIMQKINIQICQYNLIILETILKNQKDIFFQNTLYITILNLQNEESKYYNLVQENELLQYLQKYYYLINELFLSFNSYLIKKYIEKNQNNNTEQDAAWKKIYKNQNSINKVEYLLSYLIEQKEPSLEDIDTINRLKIYFNIYENLFRNQISHGWIDILYETKEIKTSITIPTSQIKDKKKIQETIKVIAFNEEKNLYDARIDMKINLKTSKTIKNLDFILCETIGKKEIKEMGVPIKIDDSEINRLRIREILKNENLNQESQEKIKYLSKQMNKENLMYVSLNNLITNIFIAVLQINK